MYYVCIYIYIYIYIYTHTHLLWQTVESSITGCHHIYAVTFYKYTCIRMQTYIYLYHCRFCLLRLLARHHTAFFPQEFDNPNYKRMCSFLHIYIYIYIMSMYVYTHRESFLLGSDNPQYKCMCSFLHVHVCKYVCMYL